MAAQPKKTPTLKKGTAVAKATAPTPSTPKTGPEKAAPVATGTVIHGLTLDNGASIKKGRGITTVLPLSAIEIVKGFNPRTTIPKEPLEVLTKAIKDHGILSAITVRPIPGKPGKFGVVAGERRVRAATAAEETHAPAIIRLDLEDDLEARAAAVSENSNDGRSPLNHIEMGKVFADMAKAGATVEAIAKSTSTEGRTVRRCLDLMSAPNAVQKMVQDGTIKVGAALELGKLPDDLRAKTLKELKDGEITETTVKATAKTLSKDTEEAATGATVGKSNNRKKGVALAASAVIWRGNKAAGELLGKLCSRFDAITSEDEKGTQEWHEDRGAIAMLLYLRTDLEDASLPSPSATSEEHKKILGRFAKHVADEAKKYNKTQAVQEATAAK